MQFFSIIVSARSVQLWALTIVLFRPEGKHANTPSEMLSKDVIMFSKLARTQMFAWRSSRYSSRGRLLRYARSAISHSPNRAVQSDASFSRPCTMTCERLTSKSLPCSREPFSDHTCACCATRHRANCVKISYYYDIRTREYRPARVPPRLSISASSRSLRFPWNLNLLKQ